MFGPNQNIYFESYNSSSHRSIEFQNKYESLIFKFKEIWPFLENYDIVLIPGSATVGIEAVIESYKNRIIPPLEKGRFAEKWRDFVKYRNHSCNSAKASNFEVQFETSLSHLNVVENIDFIDSISAFPFFDIPKNAKLFITCPNKQIGSIPGCSIICIHKSIIHEFDKIPFNSYLNINYYLELARINQTPTTFPEFLIDELNKTLSTFRIDILKDKIQNVSELFHKKIPSEFIIGNQRHTPCISISKSFIPMTRFEKLLYKNKYNDTYQFFTYSHDRLDYENFLNKI